MISNKFIFTYITCSQSIDTIGRYGVFNIYFCIASFLVYLKRIHLEKGPLKKRYFIHKKGLGGRGLQKWISKRGITKLLNSNNINWISQGGRWGLAKLIIFFLKY